MNIRFAITFSVFCVGLSGCYSFSDQKYGNLTNSPEVVYFSDRDYLPPSIVAPSQGSVDYFVGRILYKDINDKYRTLDSVFRGTPNLQIKTIATNYGLRSIITKGNSTNISLPFVGSDIANNIAIEYEISDVANITVPTENTPDREVVRAMVPPYIYSNVPVWWVETVGLSQIRLNVATAEGFSGDISYSGFKVNGEVYATSAQASYAPALCINVRPMNEKADIVVAGQQPPAPIPNTVERSSSINLETPGVRSNLLFDAQNAGENPSKVKWQASLSRDVDGFVPIQLTDIEQ